MKKKKCKKCEEIKGFADFYAHRGMLDGHLSFCKSCVKKRVSDHYMENVDEMRVREKKRYQKRKSDPEFIKRTRLASKRYKEKYKITSSHYRKLKDKNPSECSRCKVSVSEVSSIHGHHPDYSNPLDVVWLCPSCHKLEHRSK